VGYESPDEQLWKKEEQFKSQADELLSGMRKELKEAFKDRDAVGVSEPAGRWKD
jgi:hypothetical protein